MSWFSKNKREVTIVTALIDIGRGDLGTDFKRSYAAYLDRFKEILEMPNNLIIYADDEAKKLIEASRSDHNTHIIDFNTTDLEEMFPFKGQTDQIRNQVEWQSQAYWIPNSPQCKLEWYNPLVMSKVNMLHQASMLNPFKNSHFYWLDAGISGTVHPGYFWHDKVLQDKALLGDGLNFIAYPYHALSEIHGFELNAFKDLIEQDPKYVVRGGFFGGNSKHILAYAKAYNALLKNTLNRGLMGTEESIFTLLTYLSSIPIDLFYIHSNGLVNYYFEALKNGNTQALLEEPAREEINSEPFDIANDELEEWHLSSPVHFNRTLDLCGSILNIEIPLRYVDVGASTGAFYNRLATMFTVEKALLIEPLKEALEFAKTELNNPENVTFVQAACSSENKQAFLSLNKGQDNNLGVCSLVEYAEQPFRDIKQYKLATLLEEYNFTDANLIKIHTPSLQYEILQGLLPYVIENENKPVIVFDYGYYKSKDELNNLLGGFYEEGYQALNLYALWGSDFVLFPKGHPLIKKEQQVENTQRQIAQTKREYKFKTSTYLISYNLPDQFQLLMDSFEKAGHYLLYNTNLILINNSDDASSDEAFDALCEKYNIEQHKFGNMGICGGRQYAAEHFDTTNAEYMFFFEDDMLLHEPVKNSCRNGLCTWFPDLFEKSIEILKAEDFDFLKLSFTEFFGDNKEQWAWHNLPQAKREEYFPNNPVTHVDDELQERPKTHFTEIGTHEDLSYLKGEVYYCNWPHVIGKKGNTKMFLETKWEHPYEQTWMSHFFQMLKEDKLTAGLLLASPINHNRVYHYKAEQRKENNSLIKAEL